MPADKFNDKYAANEKGNSIINQEFLKTMDKIVNYAGPKEFEKNEKRGKLSVRERIDKVLDKGTNFSKFQKESF